MAALISQDRKAEAAFSRAGSQSPEDVGDEVDHEMADHVSHQEEKQHRSRNHITDSPQIGAANVKGE